MLAPGRWEGLKTCGRRVVGGREVAAGQSKERVKGRALDQKQTGRWIREVGTSAIGRGRETEGLD